MPPKTETSPGQINPEKDEHADVLMGFIRQMTADSTKVRAAPALDNTNTNSIVFGQKRMSGSLGNDAGEKNTGSSSIHKSESFRTPNLPGSEKCQVIGSTIVEDREKIPLVFEESGLEQKNYLEIPEEAQRKTANSGALSLENLSRSMADLAMKILNQVDSPPDVEEKVTDEELLKHIRGWFFSYDKDGNMSIEGNEKVRMLDDIDDPELKLRFFKLYKNNPEISFEEFEKNIVELLKDASIEKALRNEISQWVSQSAVFDADFDLFLLSVAIEGLAFVFPIWKKNTSGGIISFGVSVILTIFFAKRARTSHTKVPSFFEINKSSSRPYERYLNWALGFFGSLIAYYFMLIFFNDNILDPGIHYVETIFPITIRLTCQCAILLSTSIRIHKGCERAEFRDLKLLQLYQIVTPNPRVTNVRQLYQEIVDKIESKKDSISVALAKRTARWTIHLFGASLLPALSIIAQIITNIPNDISNIVATFDDSYEVMQHSTGLVQPHFAYYMTSIIGSVGIFGSALVFQEYIEHVVSRFSFVKMLCQMLVGATSPRDSAKEHVTYLPLYTNDNLQGFLVAMEHIRTHNIGTDLSEAAVGLTTIIVVDIAALIFILLNWLAPIRPYRLLIPLAFYAVMLTLWALLLFQMAVEINGTHELVMSRLWQIQCEIEFKQTDKCDSAKITRVRKSLEATYEPVKILGFDATPALFQTFKGYLVTILGALGIKA